MVGSATWYKISSLYTAVTRLAELDSEGERIGLGAAPPAAVLRTGTRGGDVAELQFILNRISAYYPAVPTVIQDSVFGPTTAKSVQAFQGLFGLTADGVVGPGTWNALYDAYRGIEDTQPAPAPPAPTPPAPGAAYPGYALQSGARGESVRLMQQYLNALSAVNAALPALTADGSFGPATRNAVLAFQRLYGLTQDGVIGSATWARIVAAYQSLGQNASAPYPGYYISSGSVGDYVRLIQRALNTLSAQFSSIPAVTVDGVFGPGTRSAVVAFQRLVGLLPDGVVGEQTWNQLMENR
ncbi:MAG: peptidoglycan-binding protein [Oscillospiraceae bacterium]|nr:peptidoglycan-binding protein [Oscillospiraceae bacterium]